MSRWLNQRIIANSIDTEVVRIRSQAADMSESQSITPPNEAIARSTKPNMRNPLLSLKIPYDQTTEETKTSKITPTSSLRIVRDTIRRRMCAFWTEGATHRSMLTNIPAREST